MKLQVLQDSNGNDSGVFIPIEDWILIKNNYLNIETLQEEIPQWQKDILNPRLADYLQNPNDVKDFDELLDELEREL